MEGPIKGLHVTSVVVSRFARVVIESTMMNEMTEAKEMHFSVQLPNSAFITEFKMVVAGKTIYGEVKEKVKAEQQYKKAVRAGRSGGLIKAAVRETQRFHISTNVPAQSIVVFHLVYQELLQRKFGKYDHVILINPGQIVEKFLIETTIIENSGLTFLRANCGGEENYPFSIEVIREENLGKVKFEPSIDEQRKLRELPEVDRKIVACYDVTREVLGGEIQTRNGYFVHYFAPECLPVLPKKVVFIIDRSGSMSGRKLAQTKDAFMSVIKELREIDCFNIVIFDCEIEVWKFGSWSGNNLLLATKNNVDSAVEYVKSIKTGGGSNLNDALQEGAKLLGEVKIQDKVASMMIVLTGGPPNTGAFQIRSQIQEVNRGRFSIFTLGIGNDVDRTFLERLAEENDGLFRKIYQDSDADLQLKNFFKEVASPLLLHVKIKYLGTSVMDVSRSTYDQYFYGSEIVIVGVMPEADAEFLKSSVAAITASGDISYEAISTRIQIPEEQIAFAEDFDNFIERIWAYFTVKDLLHKIDMADSEVNIRDVKSRALTLALKYRFVTSLTSMVVTDLDGQVPVEVTEDPDQICDANTYLKRTRFRPASSIGMLIPTFHSAPRHSRVDKELEDLNMRDIQDSRVSRRRSPPDDAAKRSIKLLLQTPGRRRCRITVRHSRVDKELEDFLDLNMRDIQDSMRPPPPPPKLMQKLSSHQRKSTTSNPDQICDANTYLKLPYSASLRRALVACCSAPRHSSVDKELEDLNMRDPPQILRRNSSKPVQQARRATPDELKNQPWYQNVDHVEGQFIISNIKKEGSFIVRPDDKETGSFVLIVWANGEIHNLKINKSKDGDYALEKIEGNIQTFSSVIELVEQFSKVCFELKDGVSVKLQKSQEKNLFLDFCNE